MDDRIRARAAARAGWPGGKARLGQQDEAAAPAQSSPSERVVMVWQLTRAAWALGGWPKGSYGRGERPGRVVRGRGRT